MRIPVIRGTIDRRILVNFRMDPEIVARQLPPPFRPALVRGYAIGGICLIRLVAVRPRFVPIPWGIRSENAAHRIAVEWDDGNGSQIGVFIPRRDTDSRLNAWAGGTFFAGIYHHAEFKVAECAEHYAVTLRSDDGTTRLHVSGNVADRLPASSVFGSLEAASKFFEMSSLGYSASRSDGVYDGLELRCFPWHVDPFEIEHVESSYFMDKSRFPPGSVELDCGLLMRGIEHEWQSREEVCCLAPVGA